MPHFPEDEFDALQAALIDAVQEPAARPAFYTALMKADVFVIGYSGDAPPEDHSERTLEAGETLRVQHWDRNGEAIIPFFSSLSLLQSAVEEKVNYVRLPASALFEITRGAMLFLNPKADYGKDFTPEEIDTLLAQGMPSMPVTHEVQGDTQVFLGQPSEPPVALIDALTGLFARENDVERAWLALMHDPSRDPAPVLLVGVAVSGAPDHIMKAAGVVVGSVAEPGQAVDFVVVRDGEQGLSEYFLQDVEPFYKRRWGAKLRAFFKPGNA